MRILVVDDEDDARDLLARVLRSEGYAVDVCAAAATALVNLEAGSYDVLITDESMHGMSGSELVSAALLLQTGIKCIVLSGHEEPTDSMHGRTAWISKPVDIAALLALVGPP
jgi:two-component system response regulator MtrA